MSDLFQEVDRRSSAQPASRAARRNAPSQKRFRRKRRVRSVMIVLVTAAIVVGGGYVVQESFGNLFTSGGSKELADYPGPGDGEVQIDVPQGASGAAIARMLAENGVVATQKAFLDAIGTYSKTYGGAPNLQYGTYKLKGKMPAADALLAMLEPANRIQNGLTIREGLRLDETLAKIAAVTTISLADLEKALKKPEQLGLPKEAKGNAEGWLAPATYPYTDDTTAEELLKTMIAKQISDMDGLNIPVKKRQEALIKASIVESEAPADARGKVARVIQNRLEAGWPLEMDSTVHYYDGRTDNAMTSAEARASDNPYNTYKFSGLPPGPIANPGKAAIEAAVNPEPGKWMFLVAVNTDTGETKFSETYEEHLIYQKELQEFWREQAKQKEQEKSEGSE